jgi:hypothetical protein
VHASNRTDWSGGRRKDIFFDDLLHDIGSYCKIEHIDNEAFLDKRSLPLIPSHVTSTLISQTARICARVGLPSAIGKEVCLAQEAIHQAFGPLILPKRLIYGTFARFYWSKRLYRILLARVRPRYLLIVNAYGEHALVAAAKDAGVKVVEFQHGAIDRHHVGYAWSEYARPYKASMPLPDKIFLYGNYWKHELEVDGFWDRELCAVGSARMDAHRLLGREVDPGVCTCLLTTNGLDTGSLLAFVKAFLERAKTMIPLRLYVKLHPSERSREPYERALGEFDNVTLLASQEPPSVFDLLRRTTYHMSAASTCHYEAIGLGVPTVVLPFTGHDRFLHLVRTGQAVLPASVDELLELASQPAGAKIPSAFAELYFTPGALHNMREELIK